MAKEIRIRRGTAAENAAFTGVEGEVTYSTDEKRLITHDGVAVGGEKQAKLSEVELVANKDTDGTLAANSDVKYTSQKAIKTYVDTAIGTVNSNKVDRAGDTMSGDLDISTGIHLDTDGSATFGVGNTQLDTAGKVTQYRGIPSAGSGLSEIIYFDDTSFSPAFPDGVPDTSDTEYQSIGIPVDIGSLGHYEVTLYVGFTSINLISGSANFNISGAVAPAAGVILIEFPDIATASVGYEVIKFHCAASDSQTLSIKFSTNAVVGGAGGGIFSTQLVTAARKLS